MNTNTAYAKLFAQLVNMGVLEAAGSNRAFAQNYAFSSPSAAGAVVNGRPTNGTVEWKIKGTAKTYKEWEAEHLSKEVIT
ncbi:DUF4357 domain-containing protein [Candidatus Gottesmanbacteria bacterium]|nr:DUF4357 domain-containing protein [Candidatus Gottesmanbacteria bacterium]